MPPKNEYPISKLPHSPKSPNLSDSHDILVGAHKAAKSFRALFKEACNRRGRGSPSIDNQDLLRAMLSFSCAGLDSMIKQAIRDSLREVIKNHTEAHRKFQSEVRKRLAKRDTLNYQYLAEALTSNQPREYLLQEHIEDLTSQSLQSKPQILRIAEFFAIEKVKFNKYEDHLEEIFTARNQIIHEMDVDLTEKLRKRQSRTMENMVNYTNTILQLAATFLGAVDEKLTD